MMFSSRSNRGITLIEVVISLGILVFMGAMTWQTIAGSLMLRDILEYEDSVSRSALVAMDQIKKELRVAFLTSNVALSTPTKQYSSVKTVATRPTVVQSDTTDVNMSVLEKVTK